MVDDIETNISISSVNITKFPLRATENRSRFQAARTTVSADFDKKKTITSAGKQNLSTAVLNVI